MLKTDWLKKRIIFIYIDSWLLNNKLSCLSSFIPRSWITHRQKVPTLKRSFVTDNDKAEQLLFVLFYSLVFILSWKVTFHNLLFRLHLLGIYSLRNWEFEIPQTFPTFHCSSNIYYTSTCISFLQTFSQKSIFKIHGAQENFKIDFRQQKLNSLLICKTEL